MSKINKVVIKRYQNRKLYNTRDSVYTTLEELNDIIVNEENTELVFIDNKTKNEITEFLLFHILMNNERKRLNYSKKDKLLSIIKSQKSILD